MKEMSQKNKQIYIIIACVILFAIIGLIIYYLNNRCSEYDGEYQKISYTAEDCKFKVNSTGEYTIINDYSTYEKMLNNMNESLEFDWQNKDEFNSKFFKNNSLLVVNHCAYGATKFETELLSVSEKESIANVKIYSDISGVASGGRGDVYLIPVSKVIKSAEIKYKYPEFNNIGIEVDEKPIIYLYPEKETKVDVILGNSEDLIVSYPKYVDGWNVVAKPNGDLIDIKTGRSLYSLYYESKVSIKFEMKEEVL